MKITKKFESSAVNTFKNGDPIDFIYGKGEYLYTKNNKKYLDLVCGSAVTNLGHGHKAHKDAIKEVIKTGIFHTGTRLPNYFRENLYKKLSKILPKHLNTFHLSNSGSESVESALKAVQYYTGKKSLISFTGGYHGRTSGSLSATHNKKLKNNFNVHKNVIFFPYPGTYKNKKTKYTEEESINFTKKFFRNNKKYPPAAIIECGQAVSGIILPSNKYFKSIFEILKKNKVLIIVDEVWNGFGRTGKFFSFQNYKLKPDLVCAGKAMSSSLPLSILIGSSRLLKSWPAGIHTSTFQGNPVSCALACATIDSINKYKLLKKSFTIEKNFRGQLDILLDNPYISQVRFHGASAGIEFIDKNGLPDYKIVKKIERNMLKKQILVYAGGEKGNVLMLIPPLIININVLKKSIKVLINEIKSTTVF
tara:strand:+ start:1967 stop:3226 length:1260 start_codon:yes stop_codon:yes gene_type:complete